MSQKLDEEQRTAVAEQIVMSENLANTPFAIVQQYVDIAANNVDAIATAADPMAPQMLRRWRKR
ncbi:MAG: hypothetical protein AAB873_01615 [Patescibacteria group bacterium]